MAPSSAVQLLTVICLEVTKEDKETFKINNDLESVLWFSEDVSSVRGMKAEIAEREKFSTVQI